MKPFAQDFIIDNKPICVLINRKGHISFCIPYPEGKYWIDLDRGMVSLARQTNFTKPHLKIKRLVN